MALGPMARAAVPVLLQMPPLVSRLAVDLGEQGADLVVSDFEAPDAADRVYLVRHGVDLR